MTESIHTLAKEYALWFVTATRSNGDKYLKLHTENEDIKKLIYDAHDGMLPDDVKYQFILEALEAISECTCTDDVHDITLEPDIYNHVLLKWVSSHPWRGDYVDEAIEENGYLGFYQALAAGQLIEKHAVLASVIHSLENILAATILDNTSSTGAI